ncbi:MAG: T9SS type A sorting domain-containing protein, partial [bacterium]
YSILGRDTSGTVKFDTSLSSIHIDSLKSEQVQGLEQKIIICNNNFYRDSVYISALPDSVTLIPLFNKTAQAYIDKAGTIGTILNEPITFTNGPVSIPEFITNFWESPGVDGIKGYGLRVLFDVSGEPFDFSYPASTQSYTAGTDGLPLGDLRWFDYSTAIDAHRIVDHPPSFKLLGNYPNPFNPKTTIYYELPETSHIQLVVYNILGQKVCMLVYEEQEYGLHSIQWNGRDDAGNLLPSGIYLYKLKGNHFVDSRKMSLIK